MSAGASLVSSNCCCKSCGGNAAVMKRCTRCRLVYYCSRECQIKHWPTHSQECKTQNKADCSGTTLQASDKLSHQGRTARATPGRTPPHMQYRKNDNSIFGDSAGEKDLEEPSDKPQAKLKHYPLVDFHLASSYDSKIPVSLNDKSPLTGQSEDVKTSDGKATYLFGNKHFSDLPLLDESLGHCQIFVRANKTKYNIAIQDCWSGTQIYKVLAYTLSIPMEKLKLIHKGKMMTEDTIRNLIKPRTVFQAIGEQAEDESGLNSSDIDIVMSQSGVDRNTAIVALRKKPDVVDAILEISNK
ncbi:hypothetical protein ScPMuIL_011536 [Solemya velum]